MTGQKDDPFQRYVCVYQDIGRGPTPTPRGGGGEDGTKYTKHKTIGNINFNKWIMNLIYAF
jgi:hypothetical protein